MHAGPAAIGGKNLQPLGTQVLVLHLLYQAQQPGEMSHAGGVRIVKGYLACSDKGDAGKFFRHAFILPPFPEACPAANA